MEEKLKVFKEDILKKILEREKEFGLDFAESEPVEFRSHIEAALRYILKESKLSLKHHEQEEIIGEIASYFLTLGPIVKLLHDPDISEIMINGAKEIYVERKGSLELTGAVFKDEEHLLRLIEQIITPLGKRVSTLEPYIDASLNDGSRVNIVRPPISSKGSILTIRKFSSQVLTINDLINRGALTEQVAELLRACVISRINILICGGTSSGKTTLLNALTSFIPENERVITIEDTPDLRLLNKHVIPLHTRLPNIEGKGEITLRALVINALHMRPDRIIIGEVRSDEVLDMVQAMNAGLEGSMTTLHANSSLEALDRLEVLALMGKANISSEVSKRQIINAIDLIINMARFPDGSRKIIQINEVMKVQEYQIQDIFVFEGGVLKPTGKALGLYSKLKNKANYSHQDFERGD